MNKKPLVIGSAMAAIVVITALAILLPDYMARQKREARIASDIADIKRLDDELNAAYKKLKASLSRFEKKDLRFLQRKWIEHRNRQCDIEELQFDGADWIREAAKHVNVAACLKRIISKRVDALKSFPRTPRNKLQGNVCDVLKAKSNRKQAVIWTKMRSFDNGQKIIQIEGSREGLGKVTFENGRQVQIQLGMLPYAESGLEILSYATEKQMGVSKTIYAEFYDHNGDGKDDIVIYVDMSSNYDIGHGYFIFIDNGKHYEHVWDNYENNEGHKGRARSGYGYLFRYKGIVYFAILTREIKEVIKTDDSTSLKSSYSMEVFGSETLCEIDIDEKDAEARYASTW